MQNEIPEPAPTNTIGEKKFGDKGNEEVKLDTSFDKLSLEDEEHIDLDGLEDYLNDEWEDQIVFTHFLLITIFV